jgi:hypothetical protein
LSLLSESTKKSSRNTYGYKKRKRYEKWSLSFKRTTPVRVWVIMISKERRQK